MGKRQDTINQIIKWIEGIHNTEDDILRHIHRDDDWRYERICKRHVWAGNNEYSVTAHCSKCQAQTEICIKKGIDIKIIGNNIECPNCGIKFDFKKGKANGSK